MTTNPTQAVCARIRELLPAPEAARIFAKLAEKVREEEVKP